MLQELKFRSGLRQGFADSIIIRSVTDSDGFNVRGGLERNLRGGCFAAFVKWGAALTFFVEAT